MTDMTLPPTGCRWKEGAALFREAKAWIQAADAYSHAGLRTNLAAAELRRNCRRLCPCSCRNPSLTLLAGAVTECALMPAGLFSDAMAACREGGAFEHGQQLLSLWEAEVRAARACRQRQFVADRAMHLVQELRSAAACMLLYPCMG